MKLLIIYAGDHGQVCREIAEMNGFDDIKFIDDNFKKECCRKTYRFYN